MKAKPKTTKNVAVLVFVIVILVALFSNLYHSIFQGHYYYLVTEASSSPSLDDAPSSRTNQYDESSSSNTTKSSLMNASLSSSFTIHNNNNNNTQTTSLVVLNQTITATASIPTTQQQSQQTQQQQQRRRLFLCGYKVGRLRQLLFPDFDHVGVYYPNDNVTVPTDVLYFGMHGPCPASYEELSNHFQGTILVLNGEPFGGIPKKKDQWNMNKTKFVQIGMRPQRAALPGLPKEKKNDNNDKNNNNDNDENNNKEDTEDIVYYAAMSLLGYLEPEQWQWILNPSLRPKNIALNNKNNASNVVVYMSHNCRPHRQTAAKEINRNILPVDALGKCQITKQKAKKMTTTTILENNNNDNNNNNNNHTIITHHHRSKHYNNWKLYRQYKYCLVLENSNPPNYISEKIIWAYLGGCIPIYWGSRQDVFQVFDEQSFVFWNARNVTKGLDKLRHLEQNDTAYQEMLQRPILKNGEETVRKYFSLSDDVGGGYLKGRIRKALGVQ